MWGLEPGWEKTTVITHMYIQAAHIYIGISVYTYIYTASYIGISLVIYVGISEYV